MRQRTVSAGPNHRLRERSRARRPGSLPGAELVLTNVATGQTRQLTSSPEGYFLFGDLSPAVYRLKVSASGFRELILDSLTLNVGQQMTVRPTLEIGSPRRSR